MIGQHNAEHTVADDSEEQQEAIEPLDEAVTRYSLPAASPSSNEHIYVDLHIVYSSVYRVPVLYFRGRLQGIVFASTAIHRVQYLLSLTFRR